MGFSLDFDPISSELQSREVELPVDPQDRARGTFRVTLSDIPKGKYSGLMSALAAAYRTAARVFEGVGDLAEAFAAGDSAAFDKILASGEAQVAAGDAQARATALIWVAQRELVRWGVVGHAGEDFLTAKAPGEAPTPTPFEAAKLHWEKSLYQVAADRMLKLYAHHRVAVLGRLAQAVEEFQDGRVREAEELFAAAEEAKRKADEEKRAAEAEAKRKADEEEAAKKGRPLGDSAAEAPPP